MYLFLVIWSLVVWSLLAAAKVDYKSISAATQRLNPNPFDKENTTNSSFIDHVFWSLYMPHLKKPCRENYFSLRPTIRSRSEAAGKSYQMNHKNIMHSSKECVLRQQQGRSIILTKHFSRTISLRVPWDHKKKPPKCSISYLFSQLRIIWYSDFHSWCVCLGQQLMEKHHLPGPISPYSSIYTLQVSVQWILITRSNEQQWNLMKIFLPTSSSQFAQ